jgi:hypothetical protein
LVPSFDAMSKSERGEPIFKLHPGGKVAIRLLYVNRGRIG